MFTYITSFDIFNYSKVAQLFLFYRQIDEGLDWIINLSEVTWLVSS